MQKKFDYPCVAIQQSREGKPILLFAASAIDIDQWVGIPQRLSLSGAETSGFQRTVSPARARALRKFFADPRNVIQNPLLCAVRQAPGVAVTFLPDEPDAESGTVQIEVPDFDGMSLQQLLNAARTYLEGRACFLDGRPLPTDLIVELETEINAGESSAGDAVDSDATMEEDEEEEEDGDGAGGGEPAEEALFDESQITTFWDHLRAREEIASKLPDPAEIAGFSRELLISYLRPVILVDGQHRLRGAVLAAYDVANLSTEAQELVANDVPPDEAAATVAAKRARRLPVSLLLDDSPAEHVFQFVLVNQKATPVPKALLGTIISTSLAEGELETISDRLEAAQIQLESSRIISILSKAADSPFKDLVAKGFGGDDANKLQWNVLGSLSDIFRYLKGARFYHDSQDHAVLWREHRLATSGIVADWQASDHFKSALDFWQDFNGPWMDVFKTFWRQVRNELASESPAAPNYWGKNATSNIFNKPMLHILTADFFSYLREQKAKIGSADAIPGLVSDWLEFASADYFARDWDLSGVKKDSVGTRRQWSKLWADYRQSGSLPRVDAYRKVLRG